MKKKQTKFKKNDVVVLNNPKINWTYHGPELFHGEVGLIVEGPKRRGNYLVTHSGLDGSYEIDFDEHESELIKIGVL